MKKRRMFFPFVVFSVFLFSCSSEENVELTFVGDSEIARWDVKSSFPSYIVSNHGLSGSGLLYLKSCEGIAKGTNAVVITGTNDIGRVRNDSIHEWVRNYVTAVKKLNGDRAFVYSIFPKGFMSAKKSVNDRIREANSLIQDLCQQNGIEYIEVYDLLYYKDGINPEYSYDGVHLSLKGYEIISNELRERLR